MFRISELFNSLVCLTRFFGVVKASDMDDQIARMLRKKDAVTGLLEKKIAELSKSDFYRDAARKSELENLLGHLDAWAEALQLVQSRMHSQRFGMAATHFDDQLWPLTVKLSTRYQFVTGIFGEWLYDTNSLYMLMPEYVERCMVSREGAVSSVSGVEKRLENLRISEMGELKLCQDCGQPMIPCQDCGAWVKPCFLRMGMRHVCDLVRGDCVRGDGVRGDGVRGEHRDAARN